MSEENKRDDEYYINLVNRNIGSQQDCTGMIPTVPLNDAEQEGYTDIYSVPQQVATAAQHSKNPKQQAAKSSDKGGNITQT